MPRSLKLSALLILLSSSIAFAGDYSVDNIQTRLVDGPDRDGDIKFVIKADVTNNTSDSKVFVSLQALDQQGFELKDMTLRGTIPPGSTKTLSDHSYMGVHDYRMVREWRLDE